MPQDTTHNPIPPGTLEMPPTEDLAVQAINDLVADGYTSSVMKLSRPTLNELGRRLVEPGQSVNDAAVEWLEAGGHDLKRSSIYRFAQRFREVFKRVWGGWANRLIVARLSADPDFDIEQMQDLIENRITTLVAQEVMTSDPSELKTDRLFAHMKLVADAHKVRHDAAKLRLATQQAEDRAAKLQADIEQMEREQARKDTQINERLKALRSTVDDLAKRAQRGHQVDPGLIRSIRDQLTGLAPDKPAKTGDAA